MGLNLNISSMGVPPRCIKRAYPFISEALTISPSNKEPSQVYIKYLQRPPIDQGATQPTLRMIVRLSDLSQVFEKFIFKVLSSYIEKHNILFQYQFGFRKGHSTSRAITELTDTLRKAIDSNLYTCGVILDFSKAFDTINHEILLNITF